MQWWVNVSMETQTAISCRHVSAPDRPMAGRRLLPSERGPATIQAVRDLTRGPGPYEGSGTPPEVRSPSCLRLSAYFSLDTWRLRTFPSGGTGPDCCRENRTWTTGVQLLGCS